MAGKLELTPEQKRIMYNILFAEVGGGDSAEAQAVTSTFLNAAATKGFDKAVRMSSAYNNKSPQYQIADSGAFVKNPYEHRAYVRNAAIVDGLVNDPSRIAPYTNFENVQAFGEPSWAKGQTNFKDIGRQRFYVIPQNPRIKAVKGAK